MNLTELKQQPVADLVQTAHDMGLENVSRTRKQDIIFAILKKHAKNGEDISGDGVLEILQDGFGFLRSADSIVMASAGQATAHRPQAVQRSAPASSRFNTCWPRYTGAISRFTSGYLIVGVRLNK